MPESKTAWNEVGRWVTDKARDVVWAINSGGELVYVSENILQVRGITPAQAKKQPLQESMDIASAKRITDYTSYVKKVCSPQWLGFPCPVRGGCSAIEGCTRALSKSIPCKSSLYKSAFADNVQPPPAPDKSMTNNYQSMLALRFLNMLSAIRELAVVDRLSADEERLLGALLVMWSRYDSLSYTHIVREMPRIAPSTLYRRLIALRDKGFIVLRSDKVDRRVKFVEPTTQAHEYMAFIGENLESLVQREQAS